MKNIVQIRQITIINFLSIMRNNIIKAIAGISLKDKEMFSFVRV